MITHELKEFISSQVSTECLIGRNFYHYIDGCLDEGQKHIYQFRDFEISDAIEDDEEYDEDDGYDDAEDDSEDLTLQDYVPNECWMKRFSTTEDETCQEAYLILVLELDDNMVITNINLLCEFVRRTGIGMFYIPGIELKGTNFYAEMDWVPERIITEMEKLNNGVFLHQEFSFIGKTLPQSMIAEGGNGGLRTEYTYAIQSAYRQAYMHMSINTTEEGVIEDFDYSSYQSTGNSWGDMFSRPQLTSDRKDEAVDMLLYIIDLYTDDEYKKL